MSEGSHVIVCCTDASGRFDVVRDIALQKAKETGGRVIFYDVTDSSTFTDPRPNEWAGEGEAEQYNHPLDPVALEKLGRHDLAVQVMHAREEEGVEAFGWLPNEPGGKGLLEYAARERADLILLPADDETMTEYIGDLRSAASDGSAPLATVRLVDAEANLQPL